MEIDSSVCLAIVCLYFFGVLSSQQYVSRSRSKGKEVLLHALKHYKNSKSEHGIFKIKDLISANVSFSIARMLENDLELSRQTGVDIHNLCKQLNDEQSIHIRKLQKQIKNINWKIIED